MKVLVNGQEKELTCSYGQDRIDISNDVIYNSGEQLAHDEETELPVMSEEQYEWWKEYLEQKEADDGEILRLKEIYGEDMVEEIVARESFDMPDDYNYHHQWYLELFDTIKDELEDDKK